MTIVYDNSVISKPEIRTLVPSSFKGSRSRPNGIVSKSFQGQCQNFMRRPSNFLINVRTQGQLIIYNKV